MKHFSDVLILTDKEELDESMPISCGITLTPSLTENEHTYLRNGSSWVHLRAEEPVPENHPVYLTPEGMVRQCRIDRDVEIMLEAQQARRREVMMNYANNSVFRDWANTEVELTIPSSPTESQVNLCSRSDENDYWNYYIGS